MPVGSAAGAGMIVHSRHPFNAEPRLARLRESFMTDAADFYVRSHGDIPDLAAGSHTLTVRGKAGQPAVFTVDGLKAGFPRRTVKAVMQCAGNRRADMQAVERTSGDPWAPGAIGHAEWAGAGLRDVLLAAGMTEAAGGHVCFEGADTAENDGAPDAPYAVSIPLEKAMAPEVILAWEMNGAPLAPRHGAPLRVVVPGYAGVRSVKWLRDVRCQDGPSQAFQQRHDYLLFPPDMRKETEDPSRGSVIDEMPLNSAICEPADGALLAAGRVSLRGYAVASARAVLRVDVSADGGRRWRQAGIERHGGSRWSWTFWHAELDLPAGGHELAVRAWDEAGQTQPAAVADVWNFKGYLCAAWHRIRVQTV